ncbi:MAG TPA: aminotransferase class V-fold PLP-dependent enzyme [Methylomirabilota bacterium]|nr:aminotransferase class V-fold PLP-dependent enzyme [Methylomirabilota bacterium]
MTIAELHANEELRAHEFPVVREKVFLAHAGVCPLPRRVTAAMETYIHACARGDQEHALPAEVITQTRALAAQLIGGKPTEIALVGPTSLALSYIAGGLKLKKNKTVFTYLDDYPSNVYPWMKLADRGIPVQLLNVSALGRIRARDIVGQIDEQTQLVALASCHYVAGFRAEIEQIAQELKRRGILFCVDAIQTLGAFPTTVQNIDFLAADAHKWMLGPCAAGTMFVREEVQDQLRPIVHGWHNIRCPNFVADEEMTYKPDARRYEAGTANLIGLVGLRACLELLLEVGIENIARELLRKRNWLVPAIKEKGYTVLHADVPAENQSGIVTFHKPGSDMADLHAKMEAAGIVTSLRFDRAGNKYIRLSPHFYNTDPELQRVVDLL